MAARRPVIGVTATARENSPWQVFADAVMTCSGDPVLLLADDAAGSPVSRLDGIILSGGGDLFPDLYGDTTRAELRSPSRARDELELALCQRAIADQIPILGVCRGCQVLTVAAGGTLVQDIPTELPEALCHWAEAGVGHLIRIVAGSRLAGILGAGSCYVNSSHHQAALRVGDRQVITAASPDGVIEAVELHDHPFYLGVQWHPEAMWATLPSQLRLIDALVERAR